MDLESVPSLGTPHDPQDQVSDLGHWAQEATVLESAAGNFDQ
ncbi:MAG: hypothetical protein SF066_03280 [Thermoanaerobaculia bacterium]|nr:hypothetical protein [Thermoanaerobaculia bacterium]